jgi:hypothetical protein
MVKYFFSSLLLGLLCLNINAGLKKSDKTTEVVESKVEKDEKSNVSQFSNSDGILDLTKIGNSKKEEKFSLTINGKSFLGTVKVVETATTYVKIIGIFDNKEGGFGMIFQKESISGNATINDVEYAIDLDKEKGGVYFKRKEKKEDRG